MNIYFGLFVFPPNLICWKPFDSLAFARNSLINGDKSYIYIIAIEMSTRNAMILIDKYFLYDM